MDRRFTCGEVTYQMSMGPTRILTFVDLNLVLTNLEVASCWKMDAPKLQIALAFESQDQVTLCIYPRNISGFCCITILVLLGF
jgi:hypothetical protein